jgi:DNA polymerase (family 10)
MSTNAELIRIFNEMSAALELTGGQSFKVSAYARVARSIKDLGDDIATLATSASALQKIEGVGASSAKKIIEYLETGEIAVHKKLMAKIPAGLLEVMTIPGLGPKTVKVLWEQGGVSDLASLKSKLASGELEDLPRLGTRTLQNLRESIEFAESAGGRTRLGQALPVAEAIVEHLRGVGGVQQIEYAGSLRRGQETIGDIDILAAATDPHAVAERFKSMPGVTKVLVDGGTKVSLRLERGLQVDLRIVDEGAFGAALLYFSGSKQHNVILRERAIKRKLRLNEYGLFPDDGEDEPPQKRGIEPVAARTEEEIYEELGLPWIPPQIAAS